jgi:mercuric ion binding protein
MKTILLVLLFGFLSGPTQTVKIKTSAICEMCKERIEKNLVLTKGIEKSDLNLEDQSNITVVYNPDKIDVAKIKQVIAETGYDADDVKAIKKSYEKLPNCCKK